MSSGGGGDGIVQRLCADAKGRSSHCACHLQDEDMPVGGPQHLLQLEAAEMLAVHAHDAVSYGNEAAGVGRPARLQNGDAVDAIEAEADARRAADYCDFVRLHDRT